MFLVILKFILMVVESRSSWQQFAFISKCPQYLLLHYMNVCGRERESERENMFVCVAQLICVTAVLLLHINNDFFAISASASVYLSVCLCVSLSICSSVCQSVSKVRFLCLAWLVGAHAGLPANLYVIARVFLQEMWNKTS